MQADTTTTTNPATGPAVGSIAWYAAALARDAEWLLRTIRTTYADADHTITCERVDRRLTVETGAALWRTEERLGKDGRATRLRVWCADSLLWAGEEYQAGHYTRALRGLLQATGYASEIKDLWPGYAGLDSALVHLRNAIEAVTEFVEQNAPINHSKEPG